MPSNHTDKTEISNSPLPLDEEIQESKALEVLVREETKLQLEAAWIAQRRLARACFVDKSLKEAPTKDQPKNQPH